MDQFIEKMYAFEEKMHELRVPELPIQRPDFGVQSYDGPATYALKAIAETIKDFEASLDDGHEVAMRLAAFGQSIVMNVSDIAPLDATTLAFYGEVSGNRATLIQHLTQLNFLLLAVPKAEPEKPPRRIEFHEAKFPVGFESMSQAQDE